MVDHALARRGDRLGRRYQRFDRLAVLGQDRTDLLRGVPAGEVEAAALPIEGGQGSVELGIDRLGVLRRRRCDEDLQQVLRVLHLFLDLGDGAVLLEAMLVVLGQLRASRTGLGGKFVEPGGTFADGLAGAVGLGVALAHVVQRASEQLVVAGLLLEHRHIDRVLEGVEQLGLLGQVDFQRLVHAGAGGCVAVGQHELQARDAQVRQVVVELGDLRHPATALDDAAETAPADPGQDEREGQDNAEAQDELAAYADIAKPVIHAGTVKT